MNGRASSLLSLALLASVQGDNPPSAWVQGDQYGQSWPYLCFSAGEYKEFASMTLETCMAEGDKSGASFIAFSTDSTACRVSTESYPSGYGKDCTAGFVLYEKKVCCGIDCCGAYGYPSNTIDTTCCGAAQRPYFDPQGVCKTMEMCAACTNIDGVYVVNGNHSQVAFFKYQPGCHGSIDVDPYNYNPQKWHQFYYQVNGSFVNSSHGVTGTIAPADSGANNKTITWSNGDVYKQLPTCATYPKDECTAQHGEWLSDGEPCGVAETLVCTDDGYAGASGSFYGTRLCCVSSAAETFTI